MIGSFPVSTASAPSPVDKNSSSPCKEHDLEQGGDAVATGTRRTVSRVLLSTPVRLPAKAADGHSSGTRIATRLARSTRAARSGNGPREITCHRYSILLLAGFAMPSALPQPRCALAAPFHPCRRLCGRWRSALCDTFPRVTPAGRYPAPCFRGARTFLPFPFLGKARPSILLIPARTG